MGFKIGDKVIINPAVDRTSRFLGQVFVVSKAPTRANEVNYVMKPADGQGCGVKARKSMLLPFSETYSETADTAGGFCVNCQTSYAGTHTCTLPFEPSLKPGTLVTMKGKDGYFVVTGSNPQRHDAYRLSPLGGSDRYWKNVSRRSLTVIDVSRVIVA